MSESADPHADAPVTCRNDTPGCVGLAGFDEDYCGRTLYVCQACVFEATSGEHGKER
jgi:hypothetical protein